MQNLQIHPAFRLQYVTTPSRKILNHLGSKLKFRSDVVRRVGYEFCSAQPLRTGYQTSPFSHSTQILHLS